MTLPTLKTGLPLVTEHPVPLPSLFPQTGVGEEHHYGPPDPPLSVASLSGDSQERKTGNEEETEADL